MKIFCKCILGFKEGKKIYCDWNLGCEVIDKFYINFKRMEDIFVWDLDFKEVGYFYEWGLNVCFENVEKFCWMDICFEKKNRNILWEGFMI